MTQQSTDENSSSTSLAYRIGNALYLNITNRCTNRCVFCPKFDDLTLKGYNLELEQEPTPQEILDAVGTPDKDINEIVFCGFGEPLLRLEELLVVAQELKQRGYRIRINTDGQANLVHARNIVPDLVGIVDSISVSLNAPDAVTYRIFCNTPFGNNGFKAVCDFIREASGLIPEVIASAVTVPGVDIEACRALAQSLGARFRVREYQEGIQPGVGVQKNNVPTATP